MTHMQPDGRPSNTQMRRARKAAAGPCPVMHACGGCTWIGVPYKKQLARKHRAMEELFAPACARYGWDVSIEPVQGMGGTSASTGSLPAPRGFRYKAATPFAPGAHGSIRCGFYAHGTHRIVSVTDCPVEAPGARRILTRVAEVAHACKIPAYNEDTRTGLLRYAVLRLGWRSNEGMLTVVTRNRDLPHAEEFFHALSEIDPRLVSIAHNINARGDNAILGAQTRIVAGAPCMRDSLLGCTFEISPTAFYQTNPEQTEVLYRLAIEGMTLEAGDTLIDAYCGSGTIGLAAAHVAATAGTEITLLGIERNAAGINDARRNAALNHLDTIARFEAADATAYLAHAASAGQRADIIVLDPPRAGSTPAFLAAAARMQPRRIVYISCNPVTQVRDLEHLARAGYRLIRLTPVDMFPHTEHVETIAVFERG